LDRAYTTFLTQRVSGGWPGKREAMRKWVRSRVQPRAVPAEPREAVGV